LFAQELVVTLPLVIGAVAQLDAAELEEGILWGIGGAKGSGKTCSGGGGEERSAIHESMVTPVGQTIVVCGLSGAPRALLRSVDRPHTAMACPTNERAPAS
jgi:hypothetical protein